MEISWVCLDFGGVLNDDRAARGAMISLAAELVGAPVEEVRAVRREKGSILATLEHYSAGPAAFAVLRERFEGRILENPAAIGAPPYGDVPPALERLTRKYRLALASNTVGTARPWLTRHGLTEYFSLLFLSNEVGYRKPQPEFFSELIAACGVEPGATLMVGDRTDTDLAPALFAGMRAALVRRFPRPLPGYEELREKLFAEVTDLGELADRLGC
ncbi:MAG TPA: HAD family hydrolase [bacterium]|nr:HAD family hydrolase [bacterium]